MARPFREDVNIQPQGISTGQPQALMSLSQKLDNFAAQRAQIAAQRTIADATVKGKAAAQDLEPGQKPTFKEPSFIGGIAKQAYNSALRSSYVASVDRDLTMGLNALKVKHASDLTAFNEEAKPLIAGTIKGIDPASRELVMNTADNFMASAQLQVQKATIERQMDESDEALQLSGEYYGEQASVYAFSGDDLSSQEQLVKGFNATQARVDAGTITPAQGAILNDKAIQSVKIATNRGEMSRALQLPEGIRVVAKSIQALKETPLKHMSPEQNDELVSVLTSDLNQFISLQNKQEQVDQATLSQRQNNNYSQLLVGITEGSVNQAMFNTAAKQGDISGTQYNTLSSKLSTQGFGATDLSLQLDIQQAIADGEDMTDTIVNNMGSYLTQADGGNLLKLQAEYGDGDSILNTQRYKRAERFVTESIAISGLMGQLTDDSRRQTAIVVRQMYERVLAGEDSMAVADDLVDFSRLNKLKKSAGGRGYDVNNIDGAMKQLGIDTANAVKNAGNDAQEIENLKRRYNRDIDILSNIQRLQANQVAYEKALKEERALR